MGIWASISLEMLCISYFAIRLCHELLITDNKSFCKDLNHVIYATILLVTLLDIIAYTLLFMFLDIEKYPLILRWTRPLRPFLLVNFHESKDIRRAFKNISSSLIDIFYVALLLFCSVLLFSIMGTKLFGHKEMTKRNEETYFVELLESCWDLYVLITTANNPDITIKAYETSRLYMFLSVFLAVAYSSFKSNLMQEVKDSVDIKRD